MTDWQGCYDMTGGHPDSTRAEHEQASFTGRFSAVSA